jgi:hypothetical protein
MRLSGSRRKRLLTFSVDIPLAVITLLGGLTLALTSKWRIFRYWWVIGKLGLYLATVTVGITLIGPSIDTMLDVTETGIPSDSSTRWTLVVLAGVQVTMLLAATLGVFKPGREVRRPLARRSELDAQPEESNRLPAGVGGNSGRVMRA